MDTGQSSPRLRDLAFLIAGLIDCCLGLVLLLIWFGWLPFAQALLNLPHWLAGGLGLLLAASGVIVSVYQLTKLKEPDR